MGRVPRDPPLPPLAPLAPTLAVGRVPRERARRERVHGQEDRAVCEVRPLQEAVEVQRQQVTRGDEGSW